MQVLSVDLDCRLLLPEHLAGIVYRSFRMMLWIEILDCMHGLQARTPGLAAKALFCMLHFQSWKVGLDCMSFRHNAWDIVMECMLRLQACNAGIY